MKTVCAFCGLVLTDEHGVRQHSAFFDSRYVETKPKNTDEIIYAHCEDCYGALEDKFNPPTWRKQK